MTIPEVGVQVEEGGQQHSTSTPPVVTPPWLRAIEWILGASILLHLVSRLQDLLNAAGSSQVRGDNFGANLGSTLVSIVVVWAIPVSLFVGLKRWFIRRHPKADLPTSPDGQFLPESASPRTSQTGYRVSKGFHRLGIILGAILAIGFLIQYDSHPRSARNHDTEWGKIVVVTGLTFALGYGLTIGVDWIRSGFREDNLPSNPEQ